MPTEHSNTLTPPEDPIAQPESNDASEVDLVAPPETTAEPSPAPAAEQSSEWQPPRYRPGLEDELHHLFGDRFKPPLTATWQSELPAITLDQIPTLQTTFKELGISDELAEEMYASWATFKGLNRVKNRVHKSSLAELTPEEISEGVEEQTQSLMIQVSSVERYIERYGLAELQQINQIFKTRRFAMHEPRLLHDQLTRWLRGDPVKDVAVLASADNTDKMRSSDVTQGLRTGIKGILDKLLKRPPPYFFEAKNRRELAEVAVKVGKHEREAGREPDVDHCIVYGHGGITQHNGYIVLGPDAWLSTADYVDAEADRAKLARARPNQNSEQYRRNDYTLHLGPDFETIFLACHTGEKPIGSLGAISLGEAIHLGHNMTTVSADGPQTMFQKSWNGKVKYYALLGRDPRAVKFRRQPQRQA